MSPWPTLQITTAHGPSRAVAPYVISASRATDIPAFHVRWLLERLRAGYCLWRNPFNAGQGQYVSFERCRLLVFWSKNPLPLLPHLSEIEDYGFKYYFQFTLNNYEAEGLEPGLPPLEQRLETFCRLSERLGRQRVIWRWDPLLLAAQLPPEALLERLDALGRRISPYTDKLVISFLDMYLKIRSRLAAHTTVPRAPSEAEMLALAQGLARRNAAWPHPLALSTCAEALNLSALGIASNACVDPALVSRLCPDDAEIQRFCGLDPTRASLLPASRPGKAAKDPSRRKHCQCLPAKDIGAYSTCAHACVYCYANQSQAVVRARLLSRRPGAESLI
ncbi:DUF1848 domain-containing protein [Desulfovibrio fairfieldensis]|uniref:DNA repair photolyase n=1 Tax=Desulfovibrio fairfieldensis TaxID=44742 RepID=A0A109W462_9BACT|nr:DUF1848 domain-containing protein [Desulfovibrio fairfieldensis]AMD89896.1 hypothetical protein AXF13_07070 [Desulfovibrio fairfieldensis]